MKARIRKVLFACGAAAALACTSGPESSPSALPGDAVQSKHKTTSGRSTGEGSESFPGPRIDAHAITNEISAAGGKGDNTRASVGLPEQTQDLGGIRTQRLQAMRLSPELRAQGRVLDIQPLLDLSSRYHELRSKQIGLQASLSNARHNYERLRPLYEERAISAGKWQQAELQVTSQTAEVQAVEQALRAVRQETLQDWGPTLVAWALDRPGGDFQRLLARADVLLLITLNPDDTLSDETAVAFIERAGRRRRAQAARRLSPAPRTDGPAQGETYFFRSDAGLLRTGMHVAVWLPRGGGAIDGVLIPASAVVWRAGQAWAYVALAEHTFARRLISHPAELNDGWFVSEGFHPGESIVVTGAQTLLSEEFRRKIPDEDEN